MSLAVNRSLSLMLVVAITSMVCGCGGGGGGGSAVPVSTPPVDSCSVEGQNQFVFDLMNDIYFWIDDVPAVANNGFDSPEAVLEAFLFEPLDRFSGLRDREENTAFFSDSQFIGIGLSYRVIDGDRVRLTQVFADGAAGAAGLARGDELVAIDGRAVSDLLANDELGDAFGPSEVGVTVTIDYIDQAGSPLQVQLTKGLVTIETVTLTTEFEVGGRAVGYLAFRNFVQPSFAALEDAFAQLNAAGVRSLVLDLRYNGGGLIDVAQQLASLIGGSTTNGQIFASRVHNAANVSRNLDSFFTTEADALSLTDVVVITSGATASASEMVINALTPFVPVTLVGEASFGKPVGSYQFEFCDKVAAPIAFANLNAEGNGDYYDGFAPDCVAADDLDRALGDPAEASLAEALYVVENGACSPVSFVRANNPAAKRTGAIARKQQHLLSEFRQLINAY